MLRLTGGLGTALALAPEFCFAKTENSSNPFGVVVGDPVAAKVGEDFLKNGGNAIDAAVAAAFAGGIVSPSKCGVGGYGGHAIIALAGGKKITAIDFNSVAPAAAREDMFPLDEKGRVKNKLNAIGWLAAAVPGTLAGLQLTLERYGTRSLRDVLAPAIQMCEEGVYLVPIKGIDDASRNDPRPDSAQTENVVPEKKRNLALAKLLKTLAARNSADSFYRGDIARKIADAFQKNGGLVTFADLATYHAREVAPLKLDWNGMTIHTAPLTAPGVMFLESISILKALDWKKLPALQRLHAKLEAMRIGWADRLEYFGDPEKIDVPMEKLLSSNHVSAMAEKVRTALKTQQPVALRIDSTEDEGTMNITAADRHGNMIAITLTHGGSYGARVSVEEFGMVLGHGMWRFDPRPGHANSPGPGKRAVNNMCPTVVTQHGKPILVLGAAGGTRIPNSIYEVLINFVGLGASMVKAMNVPRLGTTGGLKLGLEKGHSPEEEAFLKKIGYKVSNAFSAYVSAATFDGKSGTARGISSGGI